MQLSDIPSKFTIPFANSAGGGYIRSIPISPPGSGGASLTEGFPPANFSPVGSGGIPPYGQDFNGILKQISAWSRWYSAGGTIRYDSTFQTAIGGYPNGALVQSAVTANLFWQSTTDNNVTNPDASGAGWVNPFLQNPSVALTGTPTAPTASNGTNTTQIATTAFVVAALAGGIYLQNPSVALTGVPTAPTAAPGANTTQLATTAFVTGAISGGGFLTNPNAALTGVPTAPTASPGTNTTQISSTAFVTAAIAAGGFITNPNAALTGIPTAATASPNNNSTQLATTAYADLQAALAAGTGVLASPGYWSSPLGFIVQWGQSGNYSNGSPATVTFLVPFSTAVYSVTTGRVVGSFSGILSDGVSAVTTSGFTLSSPGSGVSSSYWIAIGK